MLFDGGDHVGQHGWTARTGNCEHIWEAVYPKAQIRYWPISPGICQFLPIGALNVDTIESPRHGVKTGGQDENVHIIVALCGSDTVCRDALNGCVVQIDERDIVPL